MILITLTTVLMSCRSCPKASELYWTSVPDPIVDGVSVVTYDVETKTVQVPLWYWLNLTDYIIDTEANKKILLED